MKSFEKAFLNPNNAWRQVELVSPLAGSNNSWYKDIRDPNGERLVDNFIT